MKTKHKQMSTFLMALALMGSMAGCSSNNSKVEAGKVGKDKDIVTEKTDVAATENTGDVIPGWQQHADDKVTLSWYINYSWFTTPWGENLVSKKITEETGVDIEFVVPAGNEAEKLNSLIASDTLPDLLTMWWGEGQVTQIIDAGMVYALDELATEYDPYWFEVADEGRVGWFTQEDGHVYGYPNSSFSPADYEKYDNISSNQTFLVRKDIYEAIGSPDMTTPEGFEAAVRKAVEQFPTVNGQSLIPIGTHEFGAIGCPSFDEYLANFLAVPYEKDGTYYDRYTDEEFVRWLKVFRQLGEEGYLSDDIFIDKRAQMEEKITQGRYFCMIYQRTDLQAQQKIIYENNPDSIYMAVDGPKNSKGENHTLPGTGINGWTVTMISKNCERPDRAIELMSYLMSEHGQLMTWLGVEGETWDYVNSVPVMKDEVRAVLKSDRSAYDKQYGADSTYWMLQDNAMALAWLPAAEEPLGQMERWTFPYVMTTSQYNITLPVDSEEADIKTKIDNEWGVVLPKLLLASSEEEFDSIWNDFMKKRKDWGMDQVIAKQTELMNQAKEKLGIK